MNLGKLVVVTGMIDPNDPCKKKRPAVVLGLVDGRVAVAPISTEPARSGEVRRGGVLLTNKSPAYARTGLVAEQVIIKVANAALYSLDSYFVRNCRQIGVLDTEKDKRVRDNLSEMMLTYDLVHSRVYDQRPRRDPRPQHHERPRYRSSNEARVANSQTQDSRQSSTKWQENRLAAD